MKILLIAQEVFRSILNFYCKPVGLIPKVFKSFIEGLMNIRMCMSVFRIPPYNYLFYSLDHTYTSIFAYKSPNTMLFLIDSM